MSTSGLERPIPAATRVDSERVRRFDRSGPRYTSYPTALEFHAGVDDERYREHLSLIADAPLGLYVHIPFCERLCTFCACHFIATPHREVAQTYLGQLAREIDLLAERLRSGPAGTGAARPGLPSVTQMHWGGGTPTYLSPSQLENLFAALTNRFDLAPEAELAIEVDPRVTTREHLVALAGLGFNRLSMGVQDFSPAVQAAIGRHQTFEQTRDLIQAARQLGFDAGINFDLVYGLPLQDEENFERNLDHLLELRPDRISMYSFAFVPWAKPHQNRIDPATLPASEVKLALHLAALERLAAAGYESIGIDHFALPDDELARAARQSQLERNFMGYTANPPSATLGLGVSAIGEVGGAYFQNERKLSSYYEALEAGRLPIQRGYLLDDDDRLRQYVIRQLMCNFAVDKTEIQRRFGVEFDRYFAAPLARLAAESLVIDDGRMFRVTDDGRMFVRNVCMAFDRYLEARVGAGKPAYSRTV